MKLYELNYLISPELPETEIKNLQEKIITFIQEKGILIDNRLAKKMVLAYPIKKRNSAFFGSLNFQSKSENLAELEKKLREESNVIRYLLLQKTAQKTRPPQRRPLLKTEEPKKEKVKIEEIEQKLEEVLGNNL